MFDTDSQFASENPDYFRATGQPGSTAPAQVAPTQQTEISKTPVANTIYDNVEIDAVKKGKNNDAPFCALDENDSAGLFDSIASFFGSGTTDIVSADVDAVKKGEAETASFLSGITKKQWLIGGGLAAGLLMLRGGNKQ